MHFVVKWLTVTLMGEARQTLGHSGNSTLSLVIEATLLVLSYVHVNQGRLGSLVVNAFARPAGGPGLNPY